MGCRFTEVAIDCTDPVALASFWCAVLDYAVVEEEPGLVTIGPRQSTDEPDEPHEPRAGGEGGPVPPVLTFAAVPEPKRGKNRLHLDLRPNDGAQSAEVDRLLALGASRADVGQGEQSWVVLVDPEGNEFCVLAPRD